MTQQQLREARRYVVVGAFFAGEIVTPPYVLSQFMLAIPLILLYVVGFVLAGFVTAHSRAQETV